MENHIEVPCMRSNQHKVFICLQKIANNVVNYFQKFYNRKKMSSSLIPVPKTGC